MLEAYPAYIALARFDEPKADAAIEEMPDLSYPYCRRGKFNELKGDRKKAMEDYERMFKGKE